MEGSVEIKTGTMLPTHRHGHGPCKRLEAAVGEAAPCEKEGLGDRRGITRSGLAARLRLPSLWWGVMGNG